MMTDTDLENLYKQNLPESHAAALRAVFAAGAASVAPEPNQAEEVASASLQDATPPDAAEGM